MMMNKATIFSAVYSWKQKRNRLEGVPPVPTVFVLMSVHCKVQIGHIHPVILEILDQFAQPVDSVVTL